MEISFFVRANNSPAILSNGMMGIRVVMCLLLVFVLVQGVQAAESYGFVTKWGTQGTGDGQFTQPTGVAVDSSGNVYVADTQNFRVQKFSPDGTFLTKWETPGMTPAGVAVDSSGNVYAIQFSEIRKFSPTGTLLMTWGSEGNGDGQLYFASGVAVDPSGNVYVTEGGNNRIQKFSSGGTFLTKWGTQGTGDGQFQNPFSSAADSSGNVYVADTQNNRIQKFSSGGTFLTKWGGLGSWSYDGEFSIPTGVAVDSSGNVYVADTLNNRIQKFSSTGSFLTKWGSEGSGDGQFSHPHGVAVDSSGNVYVADTQNNRIQKFAIQAVPQTITPTPTPTPTTVPTTVPTKFSTTVPTPSVTAKPPFIAINPLTDKYAGDKFTITAETNLAVGEEVVIRIYSATFIPTAKTPGSDDSGTTGTVKVIKGDSGQNRISFDVDTSTLKPDEYVVTAETVNGHVTSTAQFSVLTGGAAPTVVLTTTVPRTTLTTQAVPTPSPTTTVSPPSPGIDLSGYYGIILIIVVIIVIAGAGFYVVSARKEKQPHVIPGPPAKTATTIPRTPQPMPPSPLPRRTSDVTFIPPDNPKQLPQELSDRYTDIELIGKGGFARVFKAKRKDNTPVAVKIPISIDAETGKTFIAELQNWTKLDHPNIVRVFDYNIMPLPYFEMELCDRSLAGVKKPLDCEEAAWIVFHICEGLKYAHARSIAHRDLKPENILLKDNLPKISDWGLSRIISKSTSTTSGSSFTPYYAAPEQVNNRPKDERTDIWQLGIILYELTTGILPFQGDSVVEIVVNISTKSYTQPSALNPDTLTLEPIIRLCLEKDPDQRFQTVTALQKSLGMYLRKNYADLFRQSISAKDTRRSAYYVGDLIIVNLIIGDLNAAYKYSTDLVEYTQGDVKDLARELCGQLEIRIQNNITEVPDELIKNAEFVIHKVRMGFNKQG